MVVNNPNNWHWVDKNCIDWTRQYFKENLIGLTGTSGDQSAKITSIVSVEGDVVVSQRKGKVISLFDLKLVLEYEGKLPGATAKGSITVPEVAYDTEEDEYQFDVSVFNENNEKTKIKSVIKSQVIPQLRKAFAKFGEDLLATHGSDIQLSSEKVNSKLTKENQSSNTVNAEPSATNKTDTVVNNISKAASPLSSANNVSKTSTLSSSSIPKYNTSTLHFEPSFNTTAEQLYITLLEKNRLGAWTRSNPVFDGDFLKEGQEFSIFGGNIQGKITKLEPNKRIEQLWRLRDWKVGHYAKLSIDFYQGDSETKLNVLFDGIPIGQEDTVQGNFEDYYIRSIKITFGFGAVL